MVIVKADCSGCAEPFTLNTDRMVVTMTVPGNGKRGVARTAARKVTADVSVPDGSPLLEWECPFPGCGYAESHEEGVLA